MNRAFWSSSAALEGDDDCGSALRLLAFEPVEAAGCPLLEAAAGVELAMLWRLMLSPTQNAMTSNRTPVKNIAMTCLLLIVSLSTCPPLQNSDHVPRDRAHINSPRSITFQRSRRGAR